jgi:hypothetical protein
VELGGKFRKSAAEGKETAGRGKFFRRNFLSEIPSGFPTQIETHWKADRLKKPLLLHRLPEHSIKMLWYGEIVTTTCWG